MQTENDPGHREAPAPSLCPTCQAHFATITECDAHVREAHPKPPEMTADEAIAIVDGWGPEQQFGLHTIARTLRQHASLMEGNRDIWATEANELAAVAVKTTRERDEARAEVEAAVKALVASAVFATKLARSPIAEGAPGPTDAVHATCPSCEAAVDVIPGVPLVPAAEVAQIHHACWDQYRETLKQRIWQEDRDRFSLARMLDILNTHHFHYYKSATVAEGRSLSTADSTMSLRITRPPLTGPRRADGKGG